MEQARSSRSSLPLHPRGGAPVPATRDLLHPTATWMLRRSLRYFSARAVRRAVEAAYLAELPRQAGRVWAAVDAHQVPYCGRGKLERFEKGWSGSHGRRLREYRLYLAVDHDTGRASPSPSRGGGPATRGDVRPPATGPAR